ncbi:MAG: ferredoxin [Synergistaceae bacterium]|jgi:ferredoxin|nr:ferredoxin [Synergistaceae bacterium]
MRLNLNVETCIGCGVCSQVCPDVFFLDEDAGRAVISNAELADSEENLVREAIDACPIGCINW